jgi:hypothetical protein
MLGEHSLQSSDPAFAGTDIGKPVFLSTSGGFSITAPSNIDEAVVRIGIVQNTNRLWVQPEVVGVL